MRDAAGLAFTVGKLTNTTALSAANTAITIPTATSRSRAASSATSWYHRQGIIVCDAANAD
jgi:hypothetical protein